MISESSSSVLIPSSPQLGQFLLPRINTVSQQMSKPKLDALTLNDLLQKPLDNFEQLEELLSYLKSLKTPYSALYPLRRVKGCLMKVQRLKLSSYQRYIYINPIEGVLVSYHGVNKFPISPNYILKLNDIIEAKYISEEGWYKKKSNYYFSVKTANQKSIFFLNNLDMV